MVVGFAKKGLKGCSEFFITEEVGARRDLRELGREHTRTLHSVTSEGKPDLTEGKPER